MLRRLPVFVVHMNICKLAFPQLAMYPWTDEYVSRGSLQPLGYQSRDMGLYKDDDGTGYLLTEDVSDRIKSMHNAGQCNSTLSASQWPENQHIDG